MNISTLLASRKQFINHARLANLAFAYATLKRFAERAHTRRLKGLVRVRLRDQGSETGSPELVALSGNQSVIIEHFSDEDMVVFADAIMQISNDDEYQVVVRIDNLDADYIWPIAKLLERAGVSLDKIPSVPSDLQNSAAS